MCVWRVGGAVCLGKPGTGGRGMAGLEVHIRDFSQMFSSPMLVINPLPKAVSMPLHPPTFRPPEAPAGSLDFRFRQEFPKVGRPRSRGVWVGRRPPRCCLMDSLNRTYISIEMLANEAAFG